MQEIDLVVATFESDGPIELSKVVEWIGSGDLAVRGAAFAYLEKSICVSRISPALSENQFDEFYVEYLQKCFLEDCENEWAHSRYEAAWALASWFKTAILKDELSSNLFLLRDWLANVYITMPRLRAAVVNGFLEHVIFRSGSSNFFSIWEGDERLREALAHARQWNGD